MEATSTTMYLLLAGFIIYLCHKIYTSYRTQSRTYGDEYHNIIESDDHKVKGKFES